MEENDVERSQNLPSTLWQRVGSALFYGVCSLLITIINKNILTVHGFPSFQFIGLAQMVCTVVVIFIAKQFRILDIRPFSTCLFFKVCPLSFMYFGNLVFGLGGTKQLSLPMFTALRLFAILMTMLGECFLLKVWPNYTIQFSVFAMVLGNIVATIDDLSFSLSGYILVFINNAFSAAYGVTMKLKLEKMELEKYELMYYNSLFMLPVALSLLWFMGEFDVALRYKYWSDVTFLLNFCASSVMGFLLIYSTILCTFHNSALTQAVVGCVKNVVVTYIGMFLMSDYTFSVVNFVGINISMAASLLYTWFAVFQPNLC